MLCLTIIFGEDEAADYAFLHHSFSLPPLASRSLQLVACYAELRPELHL